MDANLKSSLGVLLLFGIFLSTSAQECAINCASCEVRNGVDTCVICEDTYAPYDTWCCSKGCRQDEDSAHKCDNTGACFYDRCLDGFYSNLCRPCTERIQNCDNCELLTNSDIVECTQCARGFYITTDNQHCCPLGCDSCNGTDGTACSSCKAGYFLYNEQCDTCGDNCFPPADGTARCDATTGACHEGCISNWHGDRCDVECTIEFCDQCDYDQAADFLFCIDCVAGRFGSTCELCGLNCLISAGEPEICDHGGTCFHGCEPTYRGARCDVRCDENVGMENCVECSRYSEECTSCKFGYYGTTCQLSCNANCVAFQGQLPECSIDDGTCTAGCLAGFYKNDCSGACPHCGTGVCNRDTGDCRDRICEPGYYGANCNNTCPINCAPNPASLNAFCDFDYGNCTYGCVDGRWGQFCESGCSVYCAISLLGTEIAPLCQQNDGTCLYQCKANYTGLDCLTRCETRCVDDTCDIVTGRCRECDDNPNPGYLCPTGTCDVGYYDRFCNITCPGSVNCRGGVCDRYTSYCDGCVPPMWGEYCNSTCPNCADEICAQADGVCDTACKDRYYGPQCNQNCLPRCYRCERSSGECEVCDVGTYGKLCEHDCSPSCHPDLSGLTTCSKDFGYCTSGVCEAGYHDPTCRSECNENCAANFNNIVECELETGSCVSGCLVGFYGHTCTGTCSLTCLTQECYNAADNCTVGCIDTYFGFPACNVPCNENCLLDTCFDNNGTCVFGCETGFYGHMCENQCEPEDTCVDMACDRQLGVCLECNETNPSFQCREAGCPPKTFGLYCNMSCAGGELCLDNTCNRQTGICSGCEPQRFGDYCELECPNCLNGNCSQNDGICMEGCQNGFYGQFCETNCFGRCAKCDQLTGACLACEIGTHGGDHCLFNCSSQCLPSGDGLIRCSKDDGSCDEDACSPGYFGNLCNMACGDNCRQNSLNLTYCEFESGECTNGCDVGYYGPLCSSACSGQCKERNCFNFYNFCVDGCIAEFWGSTCDIPCDVGCEDKQCKDDTGSCSVGCVEGQYGDQCENTCLDTCIDGTCNRTTGRCNECFLEHPGYECRSADCDVGIHGKFCNESCPGGLFCRDGLCDRYSSYCLGCEPGFHGNFCNHTCNGCVNGDCLQVDGSCRAACKPGYFGSKCDMSCQDQCYVCNQISGSCEICDSGRYGPICEYNCSQFCYPTISVNSIEVTCSKSTGACDEKRCLSGYYTPTCESSCNPNCLNDDCELVSGKCLYGCEIGYYGFICSGICSENCLNKNCSETYNNCLEGCVPEYYGTSCNQKCSEHCVFDNCDNSGICDHGCEFGYYGDLCVDACNETCIDGSCDRVSGRCAECSKSNPGFLCRTAKCQSGLSGIVCDEPCLSDFCLANTCARYSGKCIGCLTGLYGDFCNATCDTCEEGTTCQQVDGECDGGCVDGRYGSYCQQTCDTCIRCEQTNGLCTECPVEKYGDLCTDTCSPNCGPINGEVTCSISIGACDSGVCFPGNWGQDCRRQCNANCANNPLTGLVTCNIDTGSCDDGCINLIYGPTCILPCESYCLDFTCDRNDGICAECEEIEPNYNCPDAVCDERKYGQYCNLSCSIGCTKNCDRYTGGCTSCKPGLWQPKCDAPCTSGGDCFQCDQNTGDCLICVPGKHGDDCENDCGFCTPSQNGFVYCDKNSAICDVSSCVPGYHGRACEHACNPTCYDSGDNVNECIFNTGICSNGCDIGYYGLYCDRECSLTCKNKDCIGSATDCRQGCAFGYYGTDCLSPCPDQCVGGGCDETTGACDSVCKPGFYGEMCTRRCNSTCIDSECDQNSGDCPECHPGANTGRPTYYCRNAACDVGKYGQFCQVDCTENCLSACGRYNGTCFGCDSGFHGNACEMTCGFCNSGTCDQKTGLCTTDCMPGYWNSYCNQSCLYDGCLTCFEGNGQCETCEIGLHGTICDQTCSIYCARNNQNQLSCAKNTADCSEGRCVTGYWNGPCDLPCNQNCLPDGDGARPCEVTSGNCDIGCKDTYYGSQCESRCSLNCVDRLCERDGQCSLGCIVGTYGPTCGLSCRETCNDGTCNRTNGDCDECNKPYEIRTALCRDAACPSGASGLFCNEPCPQNCVAKCDRYNSTCEACQSGFFGLTCEEECGFCSEISCDQVNGSCVSPCLDGFFADNCTIACNYQGCKSCDRNSGDCKDCKHGQWGDNCDQSCSQACPASPDGNIYCTKSDGDCTISACIPGYYTEACTVECPSNCLPDNQTNVYCDFITGVCRDGCIDGYRGSYCSETCSSTCVDAVCERDGECRRDLGCVNEYFGIECRQRCATTCNDNTCDRDAGICEECRKAPGEQSPRCRTADCQSNDGVYYHGQFCDEVCPENCDSSCNRNNSECDACQNGNWDSFCNRSCGNCAGIVCQQSDGTCLSDCVNGFFGPKCDSECRDIGCDTCDRVTGDCVVCEQGLWGDNCELSCSNTCRMNSAGLIYCNKVTGDCDVPACVEGYFNPQCTGICSSNCLPLFPLATDKGTCEFSTGVCDHGCTQGWYEDFCDQTCSSTCVNNDCFRNGQCNDLLGCTRGFYGFNCSESCTQSCSDGTCDRTNGNCTECNKPFEDRNILCRDAACTPPLSGLFCDIPCADNCQGGICGRYDHVCTSCIDGFYGAECNLVCDNCKEDRCDEGTGACAGGCDNGYYTLGCAVPCIYQGCETCNISSGNCDVCKVKLWGNNCDLSCSSYCFPDGTDGNIYCHQFSGDCSRDACVPGYFGRDCTQTCNVHCGIDSSGLKSCNIDTGVCDVDDCEVTWYGPQCSLECPANCINRNCDRTGVCLEGCVTGYWGSMCQSICQPENTCNTGDCDQNEGLCLECQKTNPTPLCREAACTPRNKWGVFCQNDCPINCEFGNCSRDDGMCSSCKVETYGDTCDQSCPNCKGNRCYLRDGVCIDGCDDGWHQIKCMTPCKHEGCQDCDLSSGECITCKIAKYGQNCSRECERTCALTTSGLLTCNRFSGECDAKQCKEGFYGNKCDFACSDYCQDTACDIDTGTCSPCIQGWFGQSCRGECSARCKNKNCEVTENNCREGCTDGFWGSKCEKDCNSNCERDACNQQTGECLYGCTDDMFYEQTCSEPCGADCVENVCNRTGYCIRGCNTRWYGDKCQFQCQLNSSCTDGTCSRLGGICDDCQAANPGPNCPKADCPSGLQGTTCEDPCPSTNCQFNRCERYREACVSCRIGIYGSLCEKSCPNCQAGTGCYKDTGVCIEGCADGWFLPDCESRCDDVCGSCERTTGDCITCSPGMWGNNNCDNICNANCGITNLNGISYVFCEKATGACVEECTVGFWGADCSQVCGSNCLEDSNNNRQCEMDNGKCKLGCKPTFYGDTCVGVCSTGCRDRMCTNFRDNCDLGCADGYYGVTCASTCSPYCAGQGRCNSVTGECFDGCLTDHYGSTCDDRCKNTCLDDTCDETGGCPDCSLDVVGPNCRVQVCDPGYYGPTCESLCPGNSCLGGMCHRKTGGCDNGCLLGFYGSYCTEVCQCNTAGTLECDQTNGECICYSGRYGTLCDLRCNQGCVEDVCDRDGTCSKGCLDGRYGAMCDKTCSNCFNEACSETTGNCLQGCIDGWYGPQCNSRCPVECSTCDILSGACTACADEYFSVPACDQTCSSNCVSQGIGRVCNQANGNCIFGCRVGFYGLSCGQSCGNCDSCNPSDGSCPVCNAGWWGSTCKNQCSSYCARGGSSNQRDCRQSDGYCEYGCDGGYYGDTCSTACVGTNCLGGGCDRQLGACTSGCIAYFYGTNCVSRCDDCRSGQCNQANGYCIDDCPANKYGDKCDRECRTPLCTDAVCNKETGYCEDCLLSPKGPKCTEQAIASKYVTPLVFLDIPSPDELAIGNRRTQNDKGCFCVNGTCNRTDGSCQCSEYAFGNKCENGCLNCVEGSCDQENGICAKGCDSGYHGSWCNKACSSNCESCDRYSGYCITCAKGLKGIVCSDRCDLGCMEDEEGFDLCDMDTGACVLGCDQFFYGVNCNWNCKNCLNGNCERSNGMCLDGCVSGWYGMLCEQGCSPRCQGVSSVSGSCDKNSAVCTHGCMPGWVGELCQFECSANCLGKNCSIYGECLLGCSLGQFGPFCQNECPKTCMSETCSENGKCKEGCKNGFYGDICEKKCLRPCNNLTCDQRSGICPTVDPVTVVPPVKDDEVLSVEAIIGITVGSVAFIIIFVVVFVCCLNYKRRYDDAKTEIHLPSDVIERLSTHRSLHSTVSTNYPVARVVGDDAEKDFVLF